MSGYTPTIGIECHVQLKTKTKLFSAVGNDAREAPPNTLVNHICLGMPGALPVLNKAAVDLAIKAAKALNTKAQKFSAFDRKHYFYPDLPKGYQISQLYHPIIIGGYVEILVDGQKKQIGITRAHLEEDAGKNTHPDNKDFSLVDLNRTGTPLLEIVSEPEIHSAAEAKTYARELYLLMKYADVSEADLYYGNMRFDVNVSASKTTELGNRTETKNLNSFRSVERAVEYEIKRQIDLLEKGQKVIQETRGWDDAKQKTFSQRSKEDAHDYRYMPDPDIPPIILDDTYISEALGNVGPLPYEIRDELSKVGLNNSVIETVIEAMHGSMLLDVSKTMNKDLVKFIANYIANDFNSDEGQTLPNTQQFEQVYSRVKQGELNSTTAKILLAKAGNNKDMDKLAEEMNLMQISDTSELEKIVDDVLEANTKAVEDVKNGEMKAVGFLVGQVMKQSGGKANPGVVQKMIKGRLG